MEVTSFAYLHFANKLCEICMVPKILTRTPIHVILLKTITNRNYYGLCLANILDGLLLRCHNEVLSSTAFS